MATKEFKLPDVGEGVAEGELVNWLVAPGDAVSEDQPVAEVETDKALVEVPSPYDGTVKELLAEEGEIVPVGEVIITFTVGDDGDAAGAGEEPEEAEPAAEPDSEGETAPESVPEAEAEETAPAETDAPEPTEGRVFAPPSARRLARELGVDVAAVDGSGPGGRVTDADVRAHVESGGTADAADADAEAESAGPKDVDVGSSEPAATPRDTDGAAGGTSAGDGAASAASTSPAGRERTLAAPATRRAAEEAGVDLDDVPTDETREGEAFVTAEQVQQYADAVTAAKEADAGAAGAADATAGAGAAAGEGAAAGGDETVPYRGVRRTIGRQMEESKYTAPHVSHHDTAVIDDLVEARAELKERAAERDVKLTYLPFVMKALVAGLKEFPYLNSELREDDEEIVLKKEYNVGVAVATDAGLMVPVVKDVDGKSLLELAEEVTDFADRARERKLSRSEMQGGTFTVTNFGAVGGEYATPIINYPETAIMGLGAIEQRPVVEDGEVVAAHTLPLSLSIDHRVIDGAVAARFTNYVMEYLENPQLLLLE
ncbi:dihydrolipoamide acetyltransferase family protein [Halorarum salinum]|uniref:2-oxo acid dehydrogenase subunit E2 n=1 Tax=Halorarum salinum TaxID=2743089 RepID=A0A7D5Q9V0_9EURY|nr:dihydrolipoamide acetyltransferase family protein [Halobaculum salinum]QLG60939.1 2-oxo acid dehydrogenase subunit E2 [Halobaculum salinum]